MVDSQETQRNMYFCPNYSYLKCTGPRGAGNRQWTNCLSTVTIPEHVGKFKVPEWFVF